MSIDITIIVADKSHFNNFEQFAHRLGLAVERLGEVSFQKETKPWKQNFVDVIFSPQGTLICAPSREYNIAAASQASQVALLSLSNKPSFFNLECAENGSMKRIYTDLDGIIRRNTQQPLQWEQGKESYNQILSDCIKTFMGKTLDDYKNQPAIRYDIIK